MLNHDTKYWLDVKLLFIENNSPSAQMAFLFCLSVFLSFIISQPLPILLLWDWTINKCLCREAEHLTSPFGKIICVRRWLPLHNSILMSKKKNQTACNTREKDRNREWKRVIKSENERDLEGSRWEDVKINIQWEIYESKINACHFLNSVQYI